jgi:hypothetical protein
MWHSKWAPACIPHPFWPPDAQAYLARRNNGGDHCTDGMVGSAHPMLMFSSLCHVEFPVIGLNQW